MPATATPNPDATAPATNPPAEPIDEDGLTQEMLAAVENHPVDCTVGTGGSGVDSSIEVGQTPSYPGISVANVFGNPAPHDVPCFVCPVLRVLALCSVWECTSPRALDVVNNLQTSNLFWESISLFCLGHVLPLFSESTSLKLCHLLRFDLGMYSSQSWVSCQRLLALARVPSKKGFPPTRT